MELVIDNGWLKVYDNVLADRECFELINHSVKPFEDQPFEDGTKGYRTSNQKWLDKNSEIESLLNGWTEKLTKIPSANYEQTSLIRYKRTEQYKPHYDFFSVESKGYDKAILNGGNRIATALYYLNDNFEGGETEFINYQNLKIMPKLGRCVIWSNMVGLTTFGNTKLDTNTLSYHRGMPVLSGEKFIATKWIRQGEHKWYQKTAKIYQQNY